MKVTVQQMSISLRNMQKNMRRNVQLTLFSESPKIMRDIQSRSPVDSGLYRKSWRVSRNRFSSGSVFTGITISNNAPYAFYMEFGAEEGKAPWYYPNPKKKRTGKLIRRNGRVWAGGLDPGHAKTVGGAIGPVIAENNPRLNKLTNSIADSIIGGLK